jgi:hypothetical protein
MTNFRVYIYIYGHTKYIYIQKQYILHNYMYMLPFQTETEAQAILLNPFTCAHRANGSLSFVRLLTKKQTGMITKRIKLTTRTCPSMLIYNRRRFDI